jgi:hypothetical protein
VERGSPRPYTSVVLFDHHRQQLRDPIRRYVDVLAGLRAEAIVPIFRRPVIAIVYEFTEPLVNEARSAPTRAGASLGSQRNCSQSLLVYRRRLQSVK